MPVNGPPKGIGSGPAPITPDAGTPLRRAATTIAPPRGGATARAQAFGGPPQRANTLPTTSGARAPQGATLPPRRSDSLPPPRSAPASPEAGMPPGLAQAMHGFPGMAPQAHPQGDAMSKMAEQAEQVQQKAQEIHARFIEAANQSVDGVKDAVSQPT